MHSRFRPDQHEIESGYGGSAPASLPQGHAALYGAYPHVLLPRGTELDHTHDPAPLVKGASPACGMSTKAGSGYGGASLRLSNPPRSSTATESAKLTDVCGWTHVLLPRGTELDHTLDPGPPVKGASPACGMSTRTQTAPLSSRRFRIHVPSATRRRAEPNQAVSTAAFCRRAQHSSFRTVPRRTTPRCCFVRLDMAQLLPSEPVSQLALKTF